MSTDRSSPWPVPNKISKINCLMQLMMLNLHQSIVTIVEPLRSAGIDVRKASPPLRRRVFDSKE